MRGSNRGALDPETERVCRTERARLAHATDVELRVAARSEAAARRELGSAAQRLLAGRAYQRLGFVRVGDYARERLGISGRALESAAWVAARLDALPRIGTAFDRSEISWAQARALCSVASPHDEEHWLDRVDRCSARQLEAAAKSARRRNSSPPDPDADDGTIEDEPAVRMRIACPARVRALWRHAIELASRVAGQCVVPWRAAEIIAAEASSGRPPGTSFGDRALLAGLRLARRQRRVDGDTTGPFATTTDTAAAPSGRVASPDTPTPASARVASPSAVRAGRAPCDPFTLDARLVFAMHTLRTAEPRIGRLLRVLVDLRLYRTLGFPKVKDYVRERLGMSARKAWALLKVERTVRRTAAFASSYEKSLISWTRVLTLLPVLCRENEGAWIARASTVTAQRLAEEVDWTLERRDVVGAHVPLDPPPLDADLSSPVALAMAGVATTRARQAGPNGSLQNGAPAVYEVCDAEVRFIAPASVVALVRDTMDAFARPDEPRWTALERMLRHVIAYWTGIGRHRDPIFERDGWYCAVPACSSRGNLHDHHLRFRSRGGGNTRDNRIAICASHHLHGIHAGWIRAWGTAPKPVYWELGVRPDRRPLLSFIGDRLWNGNAPEAAVGG